MINESFYMLVDSCRGRTEVDTINAINAIALLKRERHVFIGVGSGPTRENVRRLAADLGRRAVFPGFASQDELPKWYAVGDVLVLPSSNEPWGLVCNEATAAGLPIVVSDEVGCGPDLVVEGKTGYVFEVGNISALAADIQDASRRSADMGQSASELIAPGTPLESGRSLKACLMDVTSSRSRQISGRPVCHKIGRFARVVGGQAMKILVVCAVFHPATIYGGPSTVALQHAVGLARRGHAVTVVTSDIVSFSPRTHMAEQSRMVDGVKIHYFFARTPLPKFPMVYSLGLRLWLRRHVHEYDVVHVHFAREWIPLTAAQIALRAEVPLFLQPHGMLNRRDGVRTFLDNVLTKATLEAASAVLVLQSHERDVIAQIAPNARTEALPNGIGTASDAPRWQLQALEGKTVLFLARLHPRKRVLDFVEMARLLHQRGLGLRFRIVGPDGGDLYTAQQRVVDYGLTDAVEFVGPIPREAVADELTRAAIYVLPSVEEPFPMSVLEALSVGTPTVVTTRIHIRDLLERNGAAAVVAPNPEALAGAVERLVTKPDHAVTLSRQGRELVERELTMDSVLERLEAIYARHAHETKASSREAKVWG